VSNAILVTSAIAAQRPNPSFTIYNVCSTVASPFDWQLFFRDSANYLKNTPF
jgi:hypothetical protein